MLTGPCLRKHIRQPCDIQNIIASTSKTGLYCTTRPEGSRANVLQRMMDSIITERHGTDCVGDLLTIILYCAPCPCLIWTAKDMGNARYFRGRFDFYCEIRIDPRLRTDCCSSLASGVERLKHMREELDELIRTSLEDFDKAAIDISWLDRMVFAAEEENPKMLNQADSVPSCRSLLNEYHQNSKSRHWNDSFITLVLGDVDHLIPLMDSLDCVPNPMVPAIGQVWQVYYQGSHWLRRAKVRYTLSNEALKQRDEIATSTRTKRPFMQSETDATRSSGKRTKTLASPPSSVGSKRRRSNDDVGQGKEETSIVGTDDESS